MSRLWLVLATTVLALALAAPAAASPLREEHVPEGAISGFGVDAQGRAVVALRTNFGSRPVLVRFGPTGSIDTSFGAGGVLRPPVAGAGARIAVQRGGGVIVGGRSGGGPAVLRRYGPDGRVDRGFGRAGKVVLGRRQLERVLLQPGGEIVALTTQSCSPKGCGFIFTSLSVDRYAKGGRHLRHAQLPQEAWGLRAAGVGQGGGFVVAGEAWESGRKYYDRFLPGGAREEALQVRMRLPGMSSDVSPNALAVRRDGKLLIATDHSPEIWRRNADGSADLAYGSGGRALCEEGERDPAVEPPLVGPAFQDVALTTGGELLAVGAEGECGLARFLADGRLDPSFGGDGSIRVEALGLPRPQALAALPDGGVLVLGWDRSARVAKLARFTAAGLLDAGFGSGGVVGLPAPSSG